MNVTAQKKTKGQKWVAPTLARERFCHESGMVGHVSVCAAQEGMQVRRGLPLVASQHGHSTDKAYPFTTPEAVECPCHPAGTGRASGTRTNSAAHNRRGVLLLVVLSMLVLFMMLGTAFIITSKQSSKQSKTLAKAAQNAASPIHQDDLLNEVFAQLVRDTANDHSVLRYHSLLRDMYGNDGIEIGPNAVSGATFLSRDPGSFPAMTTESGVEITVDDNSSGKIALDMNMATIGDQFFWVGVRINRNPALPLSKQLSLVDNYYNGLLLTFTKGELEQLTTRIVRYDVYWDVPNNQPYAIFTLLPLDTDEPIRSADLTSLAASDYTRWEQTSAVINGRPFSGTGVGYDISATASGDPKLRMPESVLIDGTPTPYPLALLPNTTFFDFDPNNPTVDATYYGYPTGTPVVLDQRFYSGLGGSDESYDAADFQNMALALMPADPSETPPLVAADWDHMMIPSLHRPVLVNYWQTQANILAEPMLLRKVLMRPNWYDHPDFTGSNPNYATIVAGIKDDTLTLNEMLVWMRFGPWDVDNDNDGVRDSVWVDFGAPVIQNADGKRVKPLAAILCIDLDGRLNLNAHGSWDIAKPKDNFNIPIAGIDINVPITDPNRIDTDILPQGQGYGPADISLAPVLDPGDPNNPKFKALLQNRYGVGGDDLPGIASDYDLRAQLKMQGTPTWAYSRSAFTTPPDLLGRYALGLNDLGQPVFETKDNQGNYDPVALDMNSPYEVNLLLDSSRGEESGSVDSIYTLDELERLLRAFDVDAGAVAPRLRDLAGNEVKDWRSLVTTDSFDLPVPNVALPSWMLEKGPDGLKQGETGNKNDEFLTVMGKPAANLSFADLLDYRIRVGLAENPTAPDPTYLDPVAVASDPVKQAAIRREMSKLLAPDLANGLRLDINRALGNGRDDNNNGVVDEPGEPEGAYWALDATRAVKTANMAANAFIDPNDGKYRDTFVDLDEDGTIEPEERGDADSSGAIDTQAELAFVQNYRRQLLARHLYVLAMTLVDPLPSTATDEDKQARAQRLAQWAINTVDFRDADNCMTPFEYELDPFQGWKVDGNLNTTTDRAGADGTPGTDDDAQVVWGCEQPELVMTESLAWHDRRTEDTAYENPERGHTNATVHAQKKPDSDYDQLYRPRGAFFLEIFNPQPENPAAGADTHLLSSSGNDLGVNLGAYAENTNTGKRSPVWRLSIHKPKIKLTDPSKVVAKKVSEMLMWDPDSPVKDYHPNEGDNADRTVYFTTETAVPATNLQAMDATDGVEFFTTYSTPSVRPGRYLVVGSGESDGTGVFAQIGRPVHGTKKRGIRLNPGNLGRPLIYEEPDGSSVIPPTEGDLARVGRADLRSGSDRTQSICSVAVIDRAINSLGSAVPRRLTITEPANGYPDKTHDGVLYSYKAQWYGTDSQRKPVDVPLDDQRAFNNRMDGETRLVLPAPGKYDKNKTHTDNPPQDVENRRIIEHFSMIYLQRLANPTLPYNPEFGKTGHDPNNPVNPYVTVDALSANATVFNGEEGLGVEERWPPMYVEGQGIVNPAYSPADGGLELKLLEYDNVYAVQYFASNQRGYTARKQQQSAQPQLWSYEKPNCGLDNNNFQKSVGMVEVRRDKMGDGAGHGSSSQNVNAIVDCTLGYLNRTYHDLRDPTKANNPNEKDAINANLQPKDQGLIQRQVIPEKPFPWLAWNNRPFVSQMELSQVPICSSSQLSRYYTNREMRRNSDKQPYVEIYSNDKSIDYWPNKKNQYITDPIPLDGAFGHLPNFFRQNQNTTTPDTETISGLYRVMEYLHVPSRFVGTETWLNPAYFGNGDPNSTADPRMNLQPPFNRISAYREPGRVNLNTIVNSKVVDRDIPP